MGRRGRRSAEAGVSPNPPKRSRTTRYALQPASSREKRDKLLGKDHEGRKKSLTDEEFRAKNAALKVENVGTALKFKSIDLCMKENRKNNYTEDYEHEDLIVRRGQPVSLALTFDRDVGDTDIVILKFSYGARPQESKGTVMRVPVYPASNRSDLGWDVTNSSASEKTLNVTVVTDVDCNIGKYFILVETKLKDSQDDITKADTDSHMLVLFNPWHQDDIVYMANEKERFEYVLNDVGRIWVGNARLNHGRAWYFGQFETPVMETALSLLDKAELSDSGRNSAVSIIRCLSALTNSMDDDGVLEGKWSSDYPKNSTKPWEWTGSVDIIQQFYDTGKPVQYGQCWVFSGVVTSLLRSLGIPTRSVTNFESAHDTDCSMTIDKHYDEEGEELDDLDDSVWNFHVWNESYFRRIDLPEGYDGWQAHDATPQETSEGVMRCGPAPLKAIREGHVYLNFDVGFIFSEVNGDKIEWEVKKDGSMEVCYINKHAVGKNISTKAVGSSDRHDLTLDYKHPDGSAEERRVVEFVNRFSTRRRHNIYKKDIKPEVKFEVIEPLDCMVGQHMTVGVRVTNNSEVERTLKIKLAVSSTFYTGVVGQKVKDHVVTEKVAPNGVQEVSLTALPYEYEEGMNAEALFKMTATCRVIETNHLFAMVEPFSLERPGLKIEVDEKIPSYTDRKAKISFKNLTNIRLHGAVIHVAAPYMLKQKIFPIKKVIHSHDEVSVDVPLFARRLGAKEIIATFSSDEITDVGAQADVFVVSKNDWVEPEPESEPEPEKTEPAEQPVEQPAEQPAEQPSTDASAPVPDSNPSTDGDLGIPMDMGDPQGGFMN